MAMLNWKLRNERAALIAGGACFSALGRCALRIRDPQPVASLPTRRPNLNLPQQIPDIPDILSIALQLGPSLNAAIMRGWVLFVALAALTN